jgi:hypothetical protein
LVAAQKSRNTLLPVVQGSCEGSPFGKSQITTALSPDDPAYAGQALYMAGFLRVYDTVVLRFNVHLVWRCPTRRLVRLYDDHVSGRHLDIGVGTGYFLDKCHWPTPSPDITLMDLNPSPFEVSAKRHQRFQPKTHQANVLEPFGLSARRFESVGLSLLLHRLPGTMATKGHRLRPPTVCDC